MFTSIVKVGWPIIHPKIMKYKRPVHFSNTKHPFVVHGPQLHAPLSAWYTPHPTHSRPMDMGRDENGAGRSPIYRPRPHPVLYQIGVGAGENKEVSGLVNNRVPIHHSNLANFVLFRVFWQEIKILMTDN